MTRLVLHLAASDALRRPWKNGRGSTEQLAIWPAAADFESGEFQWRISKARVEQPGPFSAFPGCERLLVVTHGAGMILTHGERAPRARLRRDEPYRFSGDWPTACELPDGAVGDFGLIVAGAHAIADLQVLRIGRRRARESIGPGHAFVHALSGSARARVTGEEEPFALAEHESLWAQELERELELDLAGVDPGSALIVVRIGAP